MPFASISNAQRRVSGCAFRLSAVPVYLDSVSLYTDNENFHRLQSDLNGSFGTYAVPPQQPFGTAATAEIGRVSGNIGLVIVNGFLQPVSPTDIIVDSTAGIYQPVDSDQLLFDTTLLPPDGKTPIFWRNGKFLIHSTKQDTLPSPLSAGQQIQLSRTNLAYARLYDQAGVRVATAKYTVSLGAGLITMADPLDLSAYQSPLVCEHRIQDLCTVSRADYSGRMTFTPPLGHAYDADDTYVSSVLYFGTMQARAYPVYDGATWQNVWSETLVGDEPLAEYDLINYPILVDNGSAVGDEFIFLFRTTQNFDFIGRNRGVLANGNINTDFEPINRLTGKRYLKILAAGWGSGWSVGNYLYCKITPASRGVCAIRTILAHRNPAAQDQIKIEFWGNASI